MARNHHQTDIDLWDNGTVSHSYAQEGWGAAKRDSNVGQEWEEDAYDAHDHHHHYHQRAVNHNNHYPHHRQHYPAHYGPYGAYPRTSIGCCWWCSKSMLLLFVVLVPAAVLTMSMTSLHSVMLDCDTKPKDSNEGLPFQVVPSPDREPHINVEKLHDTAARLEWNLQECQESKQFLNDSAKAQADELVAFEVAARPPNGHPWHKVHKEQQTQTQFDQILPKIEMVMSTPNISIPLIYIVRGGRVYTSSDRMHVEHHDLWQSRVHRFEMLLLHAVEYLGVNAAHLNRRLDRVVGENEDMHGIPIVFTWEDTGGCYPHAPGARLTWAMTRKAESECTLFAVPGYDLWAAYGMKDLDFWNTFIEEFPWEVKEPKAMWRGGSTGDFRVPWRELPRSVLVLKAKEHPDIFDAGFHEIVQRSPEDEEEMQSESLYKERMRFADFQKYRAILDIDGNSWSSRFGLLLCFNSVVIKVEPDLVDYFYKELIPMVHYVPVKADLSNLVEVVDYVVADENQKEMRAITDAARGWCRSKMTMNGLATDLLWTLVAYAEFLSNNDPRWRKRWQESNLAYWGHEDGPEGNGLVPLAEVVAIYTEEEDKTSEEATPTEEQNEPKQQDEATEIDPDVQTETENNPPPLEHESEQKQAGREPEPNRELEHSADEPEPDPQQSEPKAEPQPELEVQQGESEPEAQAERQSQEHLPEPDRQLQKDPSLQNEETVR